MALKLRSRRRRDPDGTMTVVEHLEELRTRLFISIGSIGVGAVAGWFLFRLVFDFLSNPYCDFITTHPQLAVNPARPCQLYATSIVEPFLLKIKLVTFIGIAIALPVILYEFWRFVTPGLTSRERRYAIPFVLSSLFLFALGAAFGILTLPKGLAFLLGFAGTERINTILSITRYVDFVMLLIAAFGLSFEFPLVLLFLTFVGVLSSRKLRDWRRYAILTIAILAAVITPSQDWFTMTAMMVPLIVFYELSILIARLLKK